METLSLQPILTPTLEPIASPLPRVEDIVASPHLKTTATQTPKPMATPSVSPKPTATPSPKSTATPTPKPTATPTLGPTPVAASSPSEFEDQNDIASQLKALERRWEASFATHDVSVTEELVAEDFVGTSSSGKVGDKATMIAEVRKDKNVYASAASEEMIVHSFGPKIVVVTGIAREVGKAASGKAFSQAYRFTDTWVERDGKWQCVAASAMTIPKKK